MLWVKTALPIEPILLISRLLMVPFWVSPAKPASETKNQKRLPEKEHDQMNLLMANGALLELISFRKCKILLN